MNSAFSLINDADLAIANRAIYGNSLSIQNH